MYKPITNDIKDFLEDKVSQYNTPAFIPADPISIPHRYHKKEDIEIAGLLAATISWGNRAQIVKAGHNLLDKMGDSPFDFVMNHTTKDLGTFNGFVYRTFNEKDIKYFIKGLRHMYAKHNGIENVFTKYATPDSLQPAIHHFKVHFFEPQHLERTEKHLADPFKGSAAKKINMYLRWLVRNDRRGVDFGLWKSIKPSQLSCPLDLHSGNIARKLGLLQRNQNDAKAVQELDAALRLLDINDPVKYDFALFGLGIFDAF